MQFAVPILELSLQNPKNLKNIRIRRKFGQKYCNYMNALPKDDLINHNKNVLQII